MRGESHELFANSTSKLLSSGQLVNATLTVDVCLLEQLQDGLAYLLSQACHFLRLFIWPTYSELLQVGSVPRSKLWIILEQEFLQACVLFLSPNHCHQSTERTNY